jgi:FkbM family methyltransferase
MSVDLRDPASLVYVLARDQYEQCERHLWATLIRENPGCVVIDGGASYGIYTLTAARAGARRIFAIEPTPGIAARLAHSVIPYPNVTVLRAALGERSGHASLLLSSRSSADNRVTFGLGPIDVVSIDELTRGLNAPLFLVKLDVQGAEVDALRGATALARRADRMTIFFEFAPSWLAKPDAIGAWLTEHGFSTFYRMQKGERGPVPVEDIRRELASVVASAEVDDAEDYVAIKGRHIR